MFKEVPLGVKRIADANTIINLLLLIPLFVFVRLFCFPLFILGLLVIAANLILGIKIKLLKNWARASFIIMQTVGLVLSIYPFLVILQFGLGNPSRFGDNYELWAVPFTPVFWGQLVSFIIGMSFPSLSMLFSIFCIFYLFLPSISKQFD